MILPSAQPEPASRMGWSKLQPGGDSGEPWPLPTCMRSWLIVLPGEIAVPLLLSYQRWRRGRASSPTLGTLQRATFLLPFLKQVAHQSCGGRSASPVHRFGSACPKHRYLISAWRRFREQKIWLTIPLWPCLTSSKPKAVQCPKTLVRIGCEAAK